jgi:predicted secreted protein
VVLVAALAAAVAAGGGAIWAAATDGALAAEASSEGVVMSPGEPRPAGRTVEVRGPVGLPTTPVPVRVGDTLVVHLKEQAGSTGYAWFVRALPGNLTLVGDVVGPPESSAIGAPTDHAFRFRVTGSGTAKLSLSLLRGGRGQSVQDVTVTVTAQA